MAKRARVMAATAMETAAKMSDSDEGDSDGNGDGDTTVVGERRDKG